MKKNIWSKFWGFLAAGLALVVCPCHLVLILSLLLSVTAGTAKGAFHAHHRGFIIAISIMAFIGGLTLAVRRLGNPSSENVANSTR
jgi:hypothetical protein